LALSKQCSGQLKITGNGKIQKGRYINMKKTFGSLLVAVALACVTFGTVSLTGCSSNSGMVDGAPGIDEPEEELSEEEVEMENEIGEEEPEE